MEATSPDPEPRVDRPSRDLVAGVVRAFAVASQRFADEIVEENRPAAAPITALTAFLTANATLLHELSGVFDAIGERETSWRDRVDSAQYEDAAATIRQQFANEPPTRDIS